ncbi:MAG: hypothetical protein Q8L81_16555 [Bacteroidota bacterium]|nr:hypothetical protein [Bacteroidota bacterium]
MKFIFYFLIIYNSGMIYSQTPEKIKFQKNSNLIYFFSKNSNTDSVVKSKSDVFYLVVPDSLKRFVTVYVENGKLLKTTSDSLVKINYMPGLKYESQYVINEIPDTGAKGFKKVFDLISLIDGPSSYQKNRILVKIINKKDEKVVIENIFIYRD